MGIQVECPHGHSFKVKDKYAGKRGLCPHCKEQTIVEVPEISKVISDAVRKAADDEKHAAQVGPSGGDSIFDDEHHVTDDSTGVSLLGSSVIQHNIRCEFCNESVPMWFAKCPSCGHFIENR